MRIGRFLPLDVRDAIRELGWKLVPARIVDVDGERAELVTIDENLMRHDLTTLERAEHLTRRNEILLALGQRAPDHRPDKGLTIRPLRTTADMAGDVGVSKSSFQHHLQIGRAIPADVRDAIRSTPTADSTTELLELARMPVDEQRKVADILHSGIKAPVKHLAALRRDRQRQTNQDIIDSVPALGASIRPDERFKTIVIDPPWDWGDEGDVNQMGRARPDYPTMAVDEIAALPIGDLAEHDAHLVQAPRRSARVG